MRTRNQFALVLKFFAKNYNIESLLPISVRLENISEEWVAIRGMLTKASCLSNASCLLDRAFVKIEEVADMEEKTANELLLLIKELR